MCSLVLRAEKNTVISVFLDIIYLSIKENLNLYLLSQKLNAWLLPFRPVKQYFDY